MKPKNLELFKFFTLAEERHDTHTSASAMMRDFMEQMDIHNIRLMLIDSEEMADIDTEAYFDKLQNAFNFMRISGNDQLESAEGRCNRCHPGVASFTFKGVNTPWHISFLFHVKNDKVVDIHECHGMWTMFPELEEDKMILLDEPVIHLQDSDWSDDDPPF
ncbi:MAG: hypothetical protein ACKO7B_15240 [Flavobacteriales bacterium]